DGCPWDRQQDFSSIAPYTVEEAYEVADAIARGDFAALKDELGDLLFQVVFHARMAEEAGYFEFDDVAGVISEKMLRRHPHVFGSAQERAAGAVDGSWEAIKAAERHDHADASALAGVARALPALKRAQKLGKRAATVGFDWPDRSGVHEKIAEELAELDVAVESRSAIDIEAEFGDLLFAVVNLARHLDVDPEKALSSANHKFERRFRAMETAIMAAGGSLREHTLEALDVEWRAAKQRVG
ncbi:MAG: nucleoside triphosphate pyrophosphohydrolase, partial [Gammaproteobacteria bacterium]|nr:nucleoside triphosphate pyrophosphohydrolase [Gammaproteobacteria bacterium]